MYFKGFIITFSCLVACIITAPTNVELAVIPIVSQSEEIQSNGTYKFSYETGNGIIREESAYVKFLPKARDASSDEDGESNESDEIHVQRGSYSYTAPDGTVISVRYIADENGFQPIYEHTPNEGNAKSADKSGRALTLHTSESSLGLSSRFGTSQLIEVNSVENTKPKTEVASDASSKPASVPEVVSVPEAAPAVIPDVEYASVAQEEPAVDPKTSSALITNDQSPVVSEAALEVVPESVPAVVPEPTPAVAAETTVNEALVASTENAQSVTESGATEASASTTPNVDVSTEVASSAAPDQPSTVPEQGPTATAELPSTTAQSSSSEVVESSSSTSAPEPSNTTEAVGQQAFEESVASSPTEEVKQPAPNVSEPSTSEEPSSTTISV